MSKPYDYPHGYDEGSSFFEQIKKGESTPQEDYCGTCETKLNEGCRTCDTRELIKNGGFEIESPVPRINDFFADWIEFLVGSGQGGPSQTAYEGRQAFVYASAPGGDVTPSFTLRQNVTVTPGCTYTLSFAENFLARIANAPNPLLTARVYYVEGGNQFDLIRTQIAKVNGTADVDKGYAFHKFTAEMPVPCNVSGVVVEFLFQPGIVGSQIIWALDAVSLRAVPGTPNC